MSALDPVYKRTATHKMKQHGRYPNVIKVNNRPVSAITSKHHGLVWERSEITSEYTLEIDGGYKPDNYNRNGWANVDRSHRGHAFISKVKYSSPLIWERIENITFITSWDGIPDKPSIFTLTKEDFGPGAIPLWSLEGCLSSYQLVDGVHTFTLKSPQERASYMSDVALASAGTHYHILDSYTATPKGNYTLPINNLITPIRTPIAIKYNDTIEWRRESSNNTRRNNLPISGNLKEKYELITDVTTLERKYINGSSTEETRNSITTTNRSIIEWKTEFVEKWVTDVDYRPAGEEGEDRYDVSYYNKYNDVEYIDGRKTGNTRNERVIAGSDNWLTRSDLDFRYTREGLIDSRLNPIRRNN